MDCIKIRIEFNEDNNDNVEKILDEILHSYQKLFGDNIDTSIKKYYFNKNKNLKSQVIKSKTYFNINNLINTEL